jgi:capsular polysaccharide biosynthesis protein
MGLYYGLRSKIIRLLRRTQHKLTGESLPFEIKKVSKHFSNAKKQNLKLIFWKKQKPFWLKKTKTKHRFLPTIQGKNIFFQPQPTWLAEVSECGVRGPDLAIFTKAGSMLAEVSLAWEKKAEFHPIFRSLQFKQVRRVDELAALLAVTGGNTYYHWMFEVLPRISILKPVLKKNPNILHVVNSLNYRFQKETLESLGIGEKKCIALDQFPALEFRRILVPSYPSSMGAPSPQVVEFLRKSFITNKIVKTKNLFPKRLYLKRAGISRRVENEENLLSILKELNFEFIDPANLSFKDQVNIFTQANVVMAPHGAALSNIVFCNPGTKVIEMFSPEYVNVCYQHLSGVCDLRHYSIHSWDKKNTLMDLNSKNLAKNPSGIKINMEEIEKEINNILNE